MEEQAEITSYCQKEKESFPLSKKDSALLFSHDNNHDFLAESPSDSSFHSKRRFNKKLKEYNENNYGGTMLFNGSQ